VKRSRLGAVALNGVLLLLVVLTVYPFWHVLMYSISDPMKAMGASLFFRPRGFSLVSFKLLFQSHGIFRAYGNSLFRTVVGTSINVILTASLAYPLSRKRFVGRNTITVLIFFTMLFSGGMIPTYLVVRSLGLLNSLWALIIPSAISAWNLFIMKNYFQGIPPELEESASLDGASPVRSLFSVIIPVSLPVIAAIALFYAVWHWNSFFDAVIYIYEPALKVLQVFLRDMLSWSSLDQLQGVQNFEMSLNLTEESVKMATVVLSVVPMLCLYPFLQKYYVKGIMIGSIKG
jgi:putative aldouronate transport system permease protein